MKKLFRIMSILFFMILLINIQAESIYELKIDLYFANGIMMKYVINFI